MKKKTKFRLKNDLALPFWIAVSFCLLGVAVNSSLFYKSFFRALTKLNEEPIAKITFKYKTAQRKFLDRVVWDRLQQNSPVYNGDMIHTAGLSEATVWFDDGTILDLAENTMAQVFRHSDGSLAADLEQGNLAVDSSEESGGMTLTAANVSVEVKAGTVINARKNEESSNLNLSVQKGQAALADGREITKDSSLVLAVSGAGEEEITYGYINVKSPSNNEKLLYHTEGTCPLHFEWELSQSAKDDKNVSLVLASDKNFTRGLQTVEAQGLNQLDMMLEKGIYYWKLSSENENTRASSGKIQVIQSLKPEIIVPAEDYSFLYRKKTPSLRFIWTEAEAATAYNFAVSKSADMTNPVFEQRTSAPSIIISTLEEGNYYWQVTPFYVVNRKGLANPSEVRSFRIEKRGELTRPELFVPSEGYYVNKSSGNVTLSWKMEREAVQYRLLISKNTNLGQPLVNRTTGENFIKLTGGEIQRLRDGQYYWAVSQIDGEGNESELSQIRSFYAINGSIVQRTVFPPENYKIWGPVLTDTRFTWKTNLNFTHRIQIARDPDFNDIAFETYTNNQVYSGVELDEGRYYWRVKVENSSFSTASKVKTFTVVPELAAPLLLEPSVNKKAVVRPKDSYKFSWTEVEDADYYRLILYKAGSEKPLFDQNFITDTYASVDMDDYDEGYYRWEVRAFSYEKENASRRSGKAGITEFKLRRIRPVKLEAPADESLFDGWDAIKNPPLLSWTSSEKLSQTRLIVRKVSGIEAEEKVYDLKTESCKLPSLSSGRYEWTVEAFTDDELDVSAVRPSYFTVKEIEPLAAPASAMTEDGSFFDAKYLRQKPYISFKWTGEKVWTPENSEQIYILEISDRKNKKLYSARIRGAEADSFKFEELSLLSKGEFNWKIKSVIISKESDEVLRDGYSAEGKFKIDFTLNTSGGKRKSKGQMYGN